MTPTRRELRNERGSVYLLAILVMLMLTIVGLAMTLTTQSEEQIGENERTLRRSFYSANAGIAISTAKALVVPDLRSIQLDLAEETDTPNLNIRNRVQMSPFTPVQDGPCNLCQINQDSPFFKINHAVSATSTRIGWTGDPDDPPDQPVPLAQKRLSVMVAFQPWRMETLTAVDALTDTNTGGIQEGF
jgi:hypothetical protein